ncbi:MAG: glycosyltransferase [Coxiella endosymbiont of Haemaphysalis qinghaiensis]
MRELHIVEPTLSDQAGHCHSYVQSLIHANGAFKYTLHVWLDRRGRNLYSKYSNEICQLHPYFLYQLRKIQKFFCLRALIRANKTIFIPTAGRIDLVHLNSILKGKKYSGKVFLHFHQFTASDEKIKLLKKVAHCHPEFIVMAPTKDLMGIFQESGFCNSIQVLCPSYPTSLQHRTISSFKKVVYAGAARNDKGFPEVVSFLEYLSQREKDTVFEVQASPPASGQYDKKSKMALLRLKNLHLAKLIFHESTLVQKKYQTLFTGAICLLIYDLESYRNKFSGVALDALYAGCPLITISETWMGEVTRQFQAGVVLKDRSPPSIYKALVKIRQNYTQFHENAKEAGEILMEKHNPKNIFKIIEKMSGSNE